MNYVYLLKNKISNKTYIGFTKNIETRIEKHLDNCVKSTKNRGGYELVYYEGYKSEKDARIREKALKSQGRQKEFLLKTVENSLLEL